MKKLILLFVFIFPLQLSAQNWSSEEKAVLDKVKLGWQSWEDAVNQKDLSIWIEKANISDTWTAWWVEDGGLSTNEDTKKHFELITKTVTRYYWLDLTPLKIRVNGDHAYIWFYTTFALENTDGTFKNIEEKRLEVYRKINGEWRWEAGMIDSYPIGRFADDN